MVIGETMITVRKLGVMVVGTLILTIDARCLYEFDLAAVNVIHIDNRYLHHDHHDRSGHHDVNCQFRKPGPIRSPSP